MPQWRSPIAMAVAFEGALGLVAGLLYWFLGGSLGPWPALGERGAMGRAVALGILATVPLLVLLLLLERYPRGPLRELRELTDRLLIPLFRASSMAELALVSLAAGLGEELLFRGWIQSSLAARWDTPQGAWYACILAAVLFGICHWLSRTYALLAGAVGLYLGGLLIYSDNMLAPITTHALYDFVALVYLVRYASRRRAAEGDSESR